MMPPVDRRSRPRRSYCYLARRWPRIGPLAVAICVCAAKFFPGASDRWLAIAVLLAGTCGGMSPTPLLTKGVTHLPAADKVSKKELP